MFSRISIILLCFPALLMSGNPPFRFVEVARDAGLDYEHGYQAGLRINEFKMMAGGAAVGDYNGDGWIDLYVIRGDIGPNLLFRNNGDGTFAEVGAQAGVAIEGEYGCGPSFMDCDGDGYLDLLIGGVENTPPRFFRNKGDGTFEDISAQSGIIIDGNTFSTGYGDYDRDGDVDMFLTHWTGYPSANNGHLWRNEGDGTFTNVDVQAGIIGYDELDFSFTPNFTDINNDGWPDILVAGDFNTSQYYINNGDGTFEFHKPPVLSDENGMGSAIADYDNDGDFDWFVSSVYNPTGERSGPGGMTGFTGNRLYQNQGDGTFEDVTDQAGVRIGYWGWGSSFADLNNDGHLDLAHTNGFMVPGFFEDPTRIFMSNGQGGFEERSLELGVSDNAQGRGLVTFDYDRDGDLDILITNNSGRPLLYRNEGANAANWLNVKLTGIGANILALGSRVSVTANGMTQIREVRCNNNYTAHQPAEVHFGLGGAELIDELKITWPDGHETVLKDVAPNRFLNIKYSKRPTNERNARIGKPDM